MFFLSTKPVSPPALPFSGLFATQKSCFFFFFPPGLFPPPRSDCFPPRKLPALGRCPLGGVPRIWRFSVGESAMKRLWLQRSKTPPKREIAAGGGVAPSRPGVELRLFARPRGPTVQPSSARFAPPPPAAKNQCRAPWPGRHPRARCWSAAVRPPCFGGRVSGNAGGPLSLPTEGRSDVFSLRDEGGDRHPPVKRALE